MRLTTVLWWCRNKHRCGPLDRRCPQCGDRRYERYANVRAAERAVAFIHPVTGARAIPPRADTPMPEEYARQGYERVEIESMTAFEKSTGLVHEASNYNSGTDPDYTTPSTPIKPDPAVRESLINDMRQALASGPWTGLDKLKDAVSASEV